MANYWRYETSGLLAKAVEDYLWARPLSAEQIGYLRSYFVQWLDSPLWQGAAELKQAASKLDSREAIHEWLSQALDLGIDPL